MVELGFLHRRARRDVQALLLPWKRVGAFGLLAAAAAVPVLVASRLVPAAMAPWLRGPLLVGLFAFCYLTLALFLGVPELRSVARRWRLDRFLPGTNSAPAA